MAFPIRERYLGAARDLEHAYLIAHNDDFKYGVLPILLQEWERLKSLRNHASLNVSKDEFEHINKVHEQVGSLFNQQNPVNYVRIALDCKLWRLAHKYFGQMRKEKMDQAFDLLCRTHGRPTNTNDTVEDGIHHVAYHPEYLLSPAKDLPGSPRIIDVLLQQKKNATPIDFRQLVEFYTADGTNSQGQTRKQIVAQADFLNLDEEEIRWLFPLKQDVDDPYFYYNFSRSSGWLGRFQSLFLRVLKAYGLEYAPEMLRRIPEAAQARESFWPNLNMTQRQHIERILKCSMELGFDTVARPFFAALKDIAVNEGKNAISDDTLKAWEKAVS